MGSLKLFKSTSQEGKIITVIQISNDNLSKVLFNSLINEDIRCQNQFKQKFELYGFISPTRQISSALPRTRIIRIAIDR